MTAIDFIPYIVAACFAVIVFAALWAAFHRADDDKEHARRIHYQGRHDIEGPTGRLDTDHIVRTLGGGR